MKPLVKKSMQQLTIGEKRFMSKQIWGNHLGVLGAAPKRMLTDEDLKAIFEYLQWQYQMPEVGYVPPTSVKLICVQGASFEGGADAIREVRQIMQRSKYVVLPVHGDAPLHWTVVVLKMEEVGTMAVEKVSYLDWLKPCVAANRNSAMKLLRLLTIGENCKFLELPAVGNKFVQKTGSNDCGFVYWYALESCMKENRAEGILQLYPQPDVWRQRLRKLEEKVQEVQQKWFMEELQKKVPKVGVDLPGDKHLDVKEYAAKILLLHKTGKLKKMKEFWTCASCRWSSCGDGCYNCNPDKAAAWRKDRETQAKALQNAITGWIQKLKDNGADLPGLPVDTKIDPTEKLEGGGSTNFTRHNIYIYIERERESR